MTIDPAWQGQVEFYELVYGTWLSYIFLTLMFEKALGETLDEWRYVLLNFVGAGAFWVNHYFQYSDFWLILINVYTVFFLYVWWIMGISPVADRSKGWKAAAFFGGIVYTFAFIGFENIARYGVDTLGYSEFWFMLTSYLGFVGVIVWRGKKLG